MIARNSPNWQTAEWQNLMAGAIREPASLLEWLELPKSLLPAALAAHGLFPLRVPAPYLARMEKGNPLDPLLLQVLPHHLEFKKNKGFTADPVGDGEAMVAPGVLHKYRGRALLVTTGACAVHCRYCFRRHYPYTDASAGRDEWQGALNYLRDNEDVEEVILSGGDPLSLSDLRLARLVAALDDIPHLRYLRLHTRLPVVLPQRVNADLLTWLSASRLRKTLVIHSNHPRELDEDVGAALTRLRQADVTLLNQSVLLRGINDDSGILAQLSHGLHQQHVLPYYLHCLDRVDGAAHFEVGGTVAGQIMKQLRERLPGFLVPQLVREQAGAPYKLPQL